MGTDENKDHQHGWDDLARLEREYDAALTQPDLEAAIATAAAIEENAAERHREWAYRTARLHCRVGRRDDAYRWLEAARDAGFWDLTRVRGDDAFQSIQTEHKFQVLCRAIWVNGYIAMLERPERASFQKMDLIFAALALRTGERVAEIGAGSGYFTIPIAREVGPTGLVWAVDVVPEMLDHLARRLRMERIENVRPVKAERDDPALPARSVDTILLIDTLHYVADRVAYATRLRATLTARGRVVIIDYRPKPWSERPWGPPPEQQIPRETIDAEMAEAGYRAVESFEFLPEQYFVIYRES